MTLFVQYFK